MQKKSIMDRLKEDEECKKKQLLQSSPSRKPNEKIVAGNQEYTDEILRSHYLMHKIRSKEPVPPIQRPISSDVHISDGMRPQTH